MSAEPPTVDISVIEHQKENILPRKHGRSAVALSNLLSAPRPQLAKQLAEGHAKHQEAVQIALEEDEDPMAAYVNYVDWVVECYPAGSNSESGLVPLLERATREFREDPRYLNDLRYLKLWICYAGIVEKPETIYAYLLANDIGSVWELFYTEYANTLERDRNMRKADEIYQLGIARKAKPLKRLQQRYEEFQKRMLAAPAGSSADVDEVMAPAPPVPTARKVLGERTKPASSADSDPFVVSASSSRANNNGARIPVFRDADQPESGIQTNEWADVGTRDSRRKENHSDGKSWQGETLPQLKHGVFTPKTPKIEVYRDTEDPAPARTPHAPRPGHEDVFAPSHQPKESEALRQNPFKNWEAASSKQPAAGTSKSTAPLLSSSTSAPSASISSAPQASSSTSDPLPAWPKPKPLKPLPSLPKRLRNPAPGPGKKAEQICLPLARLQASGSSLEEYSPDEARARALGLLGKKWAPPPVIMAVPVRDDVGRGRANDGTGKIGKKDKERTMTMTMAGEPTVTVNTRAALGDVFEMFNTSPGRDRGRTDRIEEEDEGEEVVTEASDQLYASENSNRPPVPYFEVGKSGGENAVAASNENTGSSSGNLPKANENPRNENVFRASNENGPGLSARTSGSMMAIFVDEPETAAKVKIPVFRDEPGPGVTPAGSKNVLKTKSFTPFVDSPAEEPSEAPVTAVVTPGGPLKPKTFSPFVDPPEEPKTPKAFAVFQDEEEEIAESSPSNSKFTLNPPPQLPDQENTTNKLGHINVMTPITERTCEFTMTTLRAAGSWRDEIAEDPVAEAEEEMKDAVMEPINPFSPDVLQELMAQVPVPPSVQDLSDTAADQLDALIKFGKSKKGDELPITLGESDEYSVVAKIGEGGYGAVFLAMYMPEDDEEDDSGFVDDDMSVAIKAVRPSDRWEYTVLSRLRTALPQHLHSSVIRPRRLYQYQDESFLIMDYCGQGSLLETVNRSASCGFSPANTTHPGLDELLVMFFTVELLRLISAMHAAGFVHGDLKIDNCLLRTEDMPDEARAWSSKYDPTGEHGWSYKGIRMIDFGRGIDTNLFQPGQTFIGDWPTDQRDAAELREGRPWTFQTDYFGLAGIVYCMLFGKYIETVPYQDGEQTKYKINMTLKRYWQTEMWSALFDMLLNPTTVRPDGDMPLTTELDELRDKMEQWLVENCDKGSRSLKSLLKKVSIAATEGKPI
ncbi:Mad3/BUB1 homology region 1-domain-containing protein [Rhizoctonia solani]|nr:Mad3/BUB1 homology region 1-domain-containing protein [Rhizoctonia solani]